MTLLAVMMKICLGLEWHVNHILFKILTMVKTQLKAQVDELLTTMSSKAVEGIRYFYQLLYVMQKHCFNFP